MYLEKAPEQKVIRRTVTNKNEKYRDIMKRNLLLANEKTSKRLQALNKLRFKPFSVRDPKQDEAKSFVRNMIFSKNLARDKKSTEQNVLKAHSL